MSEEEAALENFAGRLRLTFQKIEEHKWLVGDYEVFGPWEHNSGGRWHLYRAVVIPGRQGEHDDFDLTDLGYFAKFEKLLAKMGGDWLSLQISEAQVWGQLMKADEEL